MKKLVCALLITFILASFASAADFRDLSWGMTKQEVVKKETIALEEDNSTEAIHLLGGKTTIAGLEAYMVLHFLENKLVRAYYSFINEHSNRDLYRSDFNNVAALLTAIYGKPAKQDEYITKGWEDSIGLAIVSGRAYYKNKWDTGNGNFVIHAMGGGNRSVTHFVEYSNYAYQDAIKKAETEAKKKDL